MNSVVLRILAAFFLWLLIAIGCSAYYFWTWLNAPVVLSQEQQNMVVDKGESLYSLAGKLENTGLLRWSRVWVGYARFHELTNIHAGEYRLKEQESPLSMLEAFLSGKVVQYQVTFVEGITSEEAIKTLHKHSKINKTIVLPVNPSDFYLLGETLPHIEGWFFPDTYYFSAGDTDLDVLNRALKKMRQTLSEEWASRAENLPYSSSYQALVMASIIEKETGAPHEREEIAGVFVRRLQLGMRLQTDPTVIYGMGERYIGNITRKDLRAPTAYNTYTIKGLPPTPIALPGRAAIYAALHPADGDALYFVAKGDGTHVFSSTIDEHINAVNEYQMRRREAYRSNYQNESVQSGMGGKVLDNSGGKDVEEGELTSDSLNDHRNDLELINSNQVSGGNVGDKDAPLKMNSQ